MAEGHDAEAVGERVETLLSELRSQAGPQVAAAAEELVSCLVELYGAGLARITEIVGQAGPQLMDKLGLLNEKMIAAHCIHMDRADIELCGKSKMTVAHAPIGNAQSAPPETRGSRQEAR